MSGGLQRRVRLRRTGEGAGPRLELTPLIDVIFLILTFFIFSVVVMVRADVLGLDLPRTTAGQPAERRPSVVLAVAADGALRLDGEPVERAQVGEAASARLRELAEEGEPVLRVAVDERVPAGALIGVVDALKAAGIERFQILGRGEATRDQSSASDPPPESGDPAAAPPSAPPSP